METRELAGLTFACIEGCGFCCTFQPEVSTRELALLREHFRPRPVPLAASGDRTYLALQNMCGACALLSARGCTAYDQRPAHCRYFPFHVYFGEKSEVAVNYTCRGVARLAGADLATHFQQSVLSMAKAADIAAHEKQAREAYGQFERRARRADAWSDAQTTLTQARALGAAVFLGESIERLAAHAAEPLSRAEMLADALLPFSAADVTKRPFYLASDLKWITFERHASGMRVLEMDEKGALLPRGDIAGLETWEDLPGSVAEALLPYLHSLLARRSFLGSAYALVDDSEYESTVEEATWWRVAEVAVDLVARARVLRAMGIAEHDLAEETARFYDSAFLDAPTIGGWL